MVRRLHAILVPVTDVVIAEEPADSAAVRWCFARYYAELGRLFGYLAHEALPLGLEELTPPRGLVLVARQGDRPVGCGALKLEEPDIGEIKRMWVAESARGRGLGSRLLEALEARAVEAGKTLARLDTNRALTAAVRMYRRHGYREIEPFNDEPFADHWFEKPLPPAGGPGRSDGADRGRMGRRHRRSP